MNRIFGALIAAAMAMTAQGAAAFTTFSFSFASAAGTASPFSGKGFLYADEPGVDEGDGLTRFDITRAEGTFDFGATSYKVVGAGTLRDANGRPLTVNEIYSDGESDDLFQVGLSLADANGDPADVILFTLSKMGYLVSGFAGPNEIDATGATFDVAAVPEPATWAMMLLGFAAIGVAMRRRSRGTIAFA